MTVASIPTPEITQLAIAVASGLLLKIIYDWFIAGRTYMTVKGCEKVKGNCAGVIQLGKDFLEHSTKIDERMRQMDKEMDEMHHGFRVYAEDISTIKTDLAVIASWVERSIRAGNPNT